MGLAFILATCFLASLSTLGWKTCRANSSVVMSLGCFLIFFVMVPR